MGKKNKIQPEKVIPIEYIKGNFFRVIHADGVYGGLSPDLSIHMSVFSERRPIPTEAVYRVSDEGKLGEEDQSKRKVKKGFIREVDADIVFDLSTAKVVIQWLQTKVDEGERIFSEVYGQKADSEKSNSLPNSENQ